MPQKQLRTVKKSKDTGRLDRNAVRAAVIAAREARNGRMASSADYTDLASPADDPRTSVPKAAERAD
jgi:hypothetical protein